MNMIFVFNEDSAPRCDRISVYAESLDDARDYLAESVGALRPMNLVDQYVPMGVSPEMGVIR
jgi:hypothetical protein